MHQIGPHNIHIVREKAKNRSFLLKVKSRQESSQQIQNEHTHKPNTQNRNQFYILPNIIFFAEI